MASIPVSASLSLPPVPVSLSLPPVSASLSLPPVLSSLNIKTRVTVELRPSNYLQWKTQFVPFLRSQNLWGFIDGSKEAPPETIEAGTSNPEYEEWLQTDQQILSWINTTLSEECLRHVVGLGTAREAWNELEGVYNSHSTSRSRSTPRAETDSSRERRNSVVTNLNSISCSDQGTQLPTILRVPSRIRKFDPEAYDPEILSIGPYHRRKNKLKAMEKIKLKYLRDLLSRNPTVSLNDLVGDMQSKEQEARNCYRQQDDLPLSRNQFLEMMVLDGCFIVEFLLKNNERSWSASDPIFTRNLVLYSVLRDLIIVENQLPFFALSHIFDTYGKANYRLSLQKLALKFFRRKVKIPTSEQVQMVSIHDHLVHLLYQAFIPSHPLFSQSQSENDNPSDSHVLYNIPSVQGLKEAGVKFIRVEERNLLDINFNKGVMAIPLESFDDFTKFFFRNMIAYEQIHFRRPRVPYFTLYTSLMDNLINTSKDVEELAKKRIIVNSMGSNEDVKFFNQIGKGTILYTSEHYMKLISDVNSYCNSRPNRWRAKMVHDYFSNPWAIFSLGGAIALSSLPQTLSFLFFLMCIIIADNMQKFFSFQTETTLHFFICYE